MSTNEKAAKTIVRSNEYREFVATNFGIRMNDNLCELAFAFQTASNDIEIIQEQCKVILTPRSLKTLSIFLIEAVARFEADKGEIVLQAGKVDQIKGAIEKGFLKPKSQPAKDTAAG